jgi:hypothetical protein
MNSLQSSGQTELNAVGLSSGSPHCCFLIVVTTFVALILLCCPPLSLAGSRYATLSCADPELLKEFNDNLYLGRNLSRMIKRKNLITVQDEVEAKVDIIVEKVEVVLDMFPENLHFNLVLLPTARDVSKIYKKNYGKSVNHIAYYSIAQKTIYISVDDTRLKVLAHEIGHMVADSFFKVRPPYKVHELMAQFAEKHVTD